jgi:hypothetical protein
MNTELLLSAVGGGVGALILRSTIKAVGAFGARSRPIASYDCSDSGERPGDIRHGFGHRMDNDSEAMNEKSWEHTPIVIDHKGEHTIYGPYLNDFGRAGSYRVKFTIRGTGFSDTSDPVIGLDVVQSRFGTQHDMIIIGQRIVRACELSRCYRPFNVYCYAGGTSVYEYRAHVFPQYFNEKLNTIRFDSITVYRHFPIWDVL